MMRREEERVTNGNMQLPAGSMLQKTLAEMIVGKTTQTGCSGAVLHRSA
jgi:hypothetical protein